MKLVALRKHDQNDALGDPWTIVHFSMGLAVGMVEAHPFVAFGAAVGYEFMEQWAERRALGKEIFDVSGPESMPNAVVDVVVFAAGYALGRLWQRT